MATEPEMDRIWTDKIEPQVDKMADMIYRATIDSCILIIETTGKAYRHAGAAWKPPWELTEEIVSALREYQRGGIPK